MPALPCHAVVRRSSLPCCPISGYTLSSFCHVIVSRGPAAAASPQPGPAGVQCSAFAVMSSSLVLGDCAITWTMNKTVKRYYFFTTLHNRRLRQPVHWRPSSAQQCAGTQQGDVCVIITGCPSQLWPLSYSNWQLSPHILVKLPCYCGMRCL